MKIKNILVMMTTSLLMLFCSCSNELEYSDENISKADYVVRFTLGGSAGNPVTRADVVESHTEDEKQVSKLYAVIFKDHSNTAKTGVNDKENGDESFEKLTQINISNTIIEFEVGRPGAYQICFIANPNENLLNNINNLTGKTVTEFKKLTVDQAPDYKPMFMTSGFYGATISKRDAADLEIVKLTRAMARIDVVNKAPGVTIKKITFNKRAIKTVLITDQPSDIKSGYTEERKEYIIQDGLKGSVEGSKYSEKIYSYEQYYNGKDAPSMDISYDIDGKTYTHKVEFKTVAEQGTDTQINLKRNHLYNVVLSNNSGKIDFTLTVADWNRGEVFDVANQDIIDGMKKQLVEIGDYLCKDGTIIKSTDDTEIENNKENIIGVIFSLDENRIGAKNILDKKLSLNKNSKQNRIYGLVMSKTQLEAGSWKTNDDKEANPSFDFKESAKECYEDINGYSYTKLIKEQEIQTNTYPIFDKVNNTPFSDSSVLKTTGWYLPSIGEWYDIIENLGQVKIEEDKKNSDTKKDGFVIISSKDVCCKKVRNNINYYLNKIGGDEVKEESYWSSSVFSDTQARRIRFGQDDIQINIYNKKQSTSAYCVMAICYENLPFN